MAWSSGVVAGASIGMWWLWSAWVERDGDQSLLYGCMVRCERPVCATKKNVVGLDDGAQLIMRHRTIDDAGAMLFRQRLDAGSINPASEFELSDVGVPVVGQRRAIHAAFGHSAARVEAYCTFVDSAALAPKASTWGKILGALEQALGLPFTRDYATHIGNFEVIHLQSWGERPAPFLIEAVDRSREVDEDPGIRKLQICRSNDFARELHIAHVVGFGDGERVIDRIFTLKAGEIRSQVIESVEKIDSFEFSLFNETGEILLHHEAESFFTKINLVTTVLGRRMEINDRLSRLAQQRKISPSLDVSNVQAKSSQRFYVSLEKESLSRHRHVTAMRALTGACFSPVSEDRWFSRTLDNEVGVIKYFDTLMHGGSVRAAILVDPFFGVEALERLVVRLQSTDVALTIVTSWAKTDPDTGVGFERQAAPDRRLQRALDSVSPFVNLRLRVLNLVAGNDQAFHDRYLLLYPHEGAPKVFLLSNSVNRMAGKWPFCISRISDDVRNEAQAYIEGLSQGRDVTGSTNPRITFAWPSAP